jgi:hypothetical protein
LDSLSLITLQARYQQALETEPHLSRWRFRERLTTSAPARAIRNASTPTLVRGAALTPAGDPSLAAVTQGWNDVAMGLPPATMYERAPRGIQQNYEMGRAMARTVQAFQKVPVWPSELTIVQLYKTGVISDPAAVQLMAENKYFMEVDGRDDRGRAERP